MRQTLSAQNSRASKAGKLAIFRAATKLPEFRGLETGRTSL